VRNVATAGFRIQGGLQFRTSVIPLRLFSLIVGINR
jgi:hypothetical protein